MINLMNGYLLKMFISQISSLSLLLNKIRKKVMPEIHFLTDLYIVTAIESHRGYVMYKKLHTRH